MTKQKKPALYMMRYNLSGLRRDTPIKVTWKKELGDYWDRSGNVYVKGEGLFVRADHGIVDFVSADESKVQAFIDGILATKWVPGDMPGDTLKRFAARGKKC